MIAAALTALLLTGCGASLTVSDYTEDGVRYNEYRLAIDVDTVAAMEATAATNEKTGERYTVRGYFHELFADNGFRILNSEYKGGAYVMVYRRAFDGDDAKITEPAEFVTGTRLRDIGKQLEYKSALNRNPFVRHYRLTSQNPFNGVRAAYDAVKPGQSATVIQRIKNGIVSRDGITEEQIVIFPSVTAAFPYLNGLDIDGLRLDYECIGRKRMQSSGRATPINDDYSAYVFSRYFDDTERTVIFEYDLPEVYGWYLVALAVGGTVIGAFVLATRKKKQKPTLLDRFPYNPEEYRDYESHLPMNK